MVYDPIIVIGLVILAWVIPTFVLTGEPDPSALVIGRLGSPESHQALPFANLGRAIASRLDRGPTWRHSALARAITERLQIAGMAQYTATDYLASEIGAALLTAATVVSVCYLLSVPVIPLWGLGGACVVVLMRWRGLRQKGKRRQLRCRLQAPAFAEKLRTRARASGAQTRDVLREVSQSAPHLPFYQEVSKAVWMADSDPSLSLDQALDAAAVRMGSPHVRSFFNLLCQASTVGAGRLDACTNFAVQMRQETEYQAKRRLGRLLFITIASLVLLGLPSAVLQMMEVPGLSVLASLRGLGS